MGGAGDPGPHRLGSPVEIYDAQSSLRSIAVSDLDGDGLLDIAACSSNDVVGWLPNTAPTNPGSTTFGDFHYLSSSIGEAALLQETDVDQDGLPDAVFIVYGRALKAPKITGRSWSCC